MEVPNTRLAHELGLFVLMIVTSLPALVPFLAYPLVLSGATAMLYCLSYSTYIFSYVINHSQFPIVNLLFIWTAKAASPSFDLIKIESTGSNQLRVRCSVTN